MLLMALELPRSFIRCVVWGFASVFPVGTPEAAAMGNLKLSARSICLRSTVTIVPTCWFEYHLLVKKLTEKSFEVIRHCETIIIQL
jgi:hypothetical protein